MSMIEVKVPNIGDFKEVEVIEVLANPGDEIAVEQSLITVESDKASMEIPSSSAGVLKELKVKLGDRVSEGTLLALLDTAGAGQVGASSTKAPSPASAAPSPAAASANVARAEVTPPTTAPASPPTPRACRASAASCATRSPRAPTARWPRTPSSASASWPGTPRS
ncbi:MAG: biotin/lipoyl-containing protein, partial [Gammaproteobacteria bacterium]